MKLSTAIRKRLKRFTRLSGYKCGAWQDENKTGYIFICSKPGSDINDLCIVVEGKKNFPWKNVRKDLREEMRKDRKIFPMSISPYLSDRDYDHGFQDRNGYQSDKGLTAFPLGV